MSSLREVVGELDPASPDLLDKRLLQRRFDRKYLVSIDNVVSLVESLHASHAVLLAGERRLARYDTTYFDTPTLKAFHDHRRGRPRRAKVRARTYIDRSLTMLEVKQRSGRGTTVKARRERESADGPLSAEEQAWTREHTGWQDPLQPVSANAFRRLTLLGIDHVERMTIDILLSFSDGPRSISLDNTAIVEVKTPTRGQPSPAADALNRLGIRPRGFSKYCVGTLLLDESLPDNRFRLALRAMGRLEAR